MTSPTAQPRRRMGRNFRWMLLGNAANAFGMWLQLAVLARAGGPAAVGAFAFALALTAPVTGFARMQLGPLLASDAARAFSFREYRGLRATAILAALLVIALIASVTPAGRDSWRVLAPVCAMRAADMLADIYYSAWQRSERMGVIAQGMVLNTVASLLLMIVAVRLGGGVPAAACGAALGSLVALAFVHARTTADAQLARDLTRDAPVAWRRLGRLALQAAPLGVIILLSSLEHNVPRYFIQLEAGAVALGGFAAAIQLTAVGGMLAAVLGSAVAPRLASLYAAGDTASFRALTRKLALVGAGLGAAGVALSAVAGRPLLAILYRPDFASIAPTLVVLSGAAGVGFVATLLGYSLTAARIITVQPFVRVGTLAVLTVASAALVPRHGSVGAAWALVLASTVQALASAAVLGRFLAKRGARVSSAAAAPATE